MTSLPDDLSYVYHLETSKSPRSNYTQLHTGPARSTLKSALSGVEETSFADGQGEMSNAWRLTKASAAAALGTAVVVVVVVMAVAALEVV